MKKLIALLLSSTFATGCIFTSSRTSEKLIKETRWAKIDPKTGYYAKKDGTFVPFKDLSREEKIVYSKLKANDARIAKVQISAGRSRGGVTCAGINSVLAEKNGTLMLKNGTTPVTLYPVNGSKPTDLNHQEKTALRKAAAKY